jgi:arylsulfatase A-like enzyme/Tfp pilus assembly protein PilF
MAGRTRFRRGTILAASLLVAAPLFRTIGRTVGSPGGRPLGPADASREPASSTARISSSPSVVLITLDTVRADHLGCYGYVKAETPALDGLARGGVRFANAYTVVPITLPSHAVILSGTYPMWNGVRDFTSPGLRAGIPTLAGILKERGYATAAFVSAFALNSMWGLNRGFDVYDDETPTGAAPGNDPFLVTRPGDATTSRMLAWLDGHAEKPFFAWLHLYDAHSPYRSPEPYRSRHAGHPYDGAIAFDDAQVGRVLDALRRKGLYDQTLVIVTSDHGESLGEHGEAEHGFFVYNATLRIPLIVKWPGSGGRGQVVTEPVSSIDLAPTIAQAAGTAAAGERSFQGKPLTRFLGDQRASPAPVYAESYYARDSFGWHELRALVTGKFKYIDAPEPELYDLERDPGERSNIAGAERALAGSLRATLEDIERRFEGPKESASGAGLDPETLEKLKSLGYVAYQAGPSQGGDDSGRADPKQKIEIYNQILRAGDLRRAGKYPEASALIASLKQREPTLYVLPFEAGENDLAWGKPQEAIGELRAALQLNPRFDQAALGLGRAYFELGQDANATTALELALRLNPNNFLARLALANVYVHQNSLEKAEAELARLVAEHPGYAQGHADYGAVLVRRKNYAQAEKEIERSLALGHRDALTLDSLGIARAELGRPKEAIEAYQQAVKLDPHYAAAYLNLALEYRRLGELAEALQYYRKVCELSDQLCREYRAQFPEP